MKNLILFVCILCSVIVYAQSSTTIIPIPVYIPSSEPNAYYVDETNMIYRSRVSSFANTENVTKIIIDGKPIFVHNKSTLSEPEIIDKIKQYEKEDIRNLFIILGGILVFIGLAVLIVTRVVNKNLWIYGD